MLGGISRVSNDKIYTHKSVSAHDAWIMKTGQLNDKSENLTWLL